MPSAIATSTQRRATLVYALMMSGLLALASYLQPPELRFLTGIPVSDAPPAELLPLDDIPVPDFAAIDDIDIRKQTFFDFLQPFIDNSNRRILRKRERLLALVAKVEQGMAFSQDERSFIRELSNDYDLSGSNLRDLTFLSRLLRRVDIIPPSLALAQAANESAWGTSRFATQGNNFFGQWCYSAGCGLVPRRRTSEASHEVKVFDTVSAAVDAYIMNLNTFPSYLDLRLIRENLRQRSVPVDGISLTRGLGSYSERGEEYIDELQSMIRFNDLLERDSAFITRLSLDLSREQSTNSSGRSLPAGCSYSENVC